MAAGFSVESSVCHLVAVSAGAQVVKVPRFITSFSPQKLWNSLTAFSGDVKEN